AAPASIAAAAWTAPWVRLPGSAAKRSPGSTVAVLRVTPVSTVSVVVGASTPRWPATSATVRRGASCGLARITSTIPPTLSAVRSSPVETDLGLRRARGRDAGPFQRHRHDVVEHRSGGRAAARAGVGLVEHDVGEEPRLVRRREADERHRVL